MPNIVSSDPGIRPVSRLGGPERVQAFYQARGVSLGQGGPVLPLYGIDDIIGEGGGWRQMGSATSQIQGRRGKVFDMQSEGDTITVIGKAPVAELFGFAGDIRSATEGRAMWSTEFAGFEMGTPADI